MELIKTTILREGGFFIGCAALNAVGGTIASSGRRRSSERTDKYYSRTNYANAPAEIVGEVREAGRVHQVRLIRNSAVKRLSIHRFIAQSFVKKMSWKENRESIELPCDRFL